MRSDAAVNRKDDPYIYQFFNVMVFYQKSDGKANNAMLNIYNSLIEALNKYARLPRFIFVIPDHDLVIQANHFKYGMNFILEDQLNWLAKKIEKALYMRRVDLKDKLLGAVGHEPRVIWVKMIQRPLVKGHTYKYYNNVVNLRRKFNTILDEMVSVTRNTHLIDPTDAFDDYVHYDHLGNLAHEGKFQFWRVIDSEFKKYDKGDSDLLPANRPRGTPQKKKKKKSNREEKWDRPQYDEKEENFDEYYTAHYYEDY